MKIEPMPLMRLKEINDAQPSDASYGNVFQAIARAAQADALRQVIEWLEKKPGLIGTIKDLHFALTEIEGEK